MFGTTQKTENVSHKVVQKVREHHWKVTSQYRVYCYEGNDPLKNMNSIDLLSRSASTTITTTGSRDSPFPSHIKHDPVRQDLTWILRNISEVDGKRTCTFEIDRTKQTCCTPRRNDETEEALYFFDNLSGWFEKLRNHFIKHVEGDILAKHDPANPMPQTQLAPGLGTISDSQIFTPVLPLMEPNLENSGISSTVEQAKSLLVLRSPSGGSDSPLLSLGDIDKFLNAQCRSLSDAMSTLTTLFPSHQLMKLVTVAEASLVLFSLSAISLFTQFQQSIEYVEEMLRVQLISAIGKEIKSDDFDRFMSFYNEKIFGLGFCPKPFSYAVRRPNHYPDGIVSIENVGEKSEPIRTHVRHIAGGEDVPSMSIPINAATSVEMKGDRYLHGWVNHRFESSTLGPFALTARARQFSSFLLMVGVLGGANKFEPKDAIIVQNKDEVLIPLLLKELPSARDFKDAISSLSPEQQRFAKAFRDMQLESSVFAICIVQLKPQLESLLGLPSGSLTKEIKLTQNLLSLFIDYQVPSDLLSFDGAEDASKGDKVYCVKRHVSAVMDVIDEAKKAELEEMEQKAAFQKNKLEAEKRFAEVRKTVAPTAAAANPIPPPLPAGATVQAMGGGQIHNPLSAAVVNSSNSLHPTPAPAPQPFPESEGQLDAFAEADFALSDEVGNVSPAISCSSPSDFKLEGQESAPLVSDANTVDFTNIPKQLDSIFEKNDVDGSIRATTVETELPWKRSRPESLFSSPSNTKLKKASFDLDAKSCKIESNKAFDLLDALSRSGTLSLDFAELHVLVAVTHSFENDVVGTVIQDNINPIEKVEKALMMVAGTIHGCGNDGSTLDQLIADGPHRARLLEAVDVSALSPVTGSGSVSPSNNDVTASEPSSHDENGSEQMSNKASVKTI